MQIGKGGKKKKEKKRETRQKRERVRRKKEKRGGEGFDRRYLYSCDCSRRCTGKKGVVRYSITSFRSISKVNWSVVGRWPMGKRNLKGKPSSRFDISDKRSRSVYFNFIRAFFSLPSIKKIYSTDNSLRFNFFFFFLIIQFSVASYSIFLF